MLHIAVNNDGLSKTKSQSHGSFHWAGIVDTPSFLAHESFCPRAQLNRGVNSCSIHPRQGVWLYWHVPVTGQR